jgi:HPr kinase/phosphorylase
LVADDVVCIERVGDFLIGKPPENFPGLLEVRGLGIIDVRKFSGPATFEPQHRIDLCIEFRSAESSDQPALFGREGSKFEMFGVSIPRFAVSVDGYRNLRAIVETVVRLNGCVADEYRISNL